MSAAQTADTLDTLGGLLEGIPIVGAWAKVGLGLASAVLRAGGTPDHITMIDVAALVASRKVADADLDARAEEHDR